jgi:hypothetical protein
MENISYIFVGMFRDPLILKLPYTIPLLEYAKNFLNAMKPL